MNLENISIGNAAGFIKTLEQVQAACKGAATEITVGSITIEELLGNQSDPGYSQPPYYYHPAFGWSVNSLGLPNMGLEKICIELPEMVRIAHAAGKTLRVSVAGFKPEQYATLTAECFALGADEIELNMGCPNTWKSSGEQKAIPSYDPRLAQEILYRTRDAIPSGRKVGVKISPVLELTILTPLAHFFRESRIVNKVIGCNTIPNRDPRDETGRYAISFNAGNHKGGLAGGLEMRRDSLQVCKWMRGNLPDSIEVCGVGGISEGKHAQQYLDIGVSGIQIGTAYFERGPRVVSEVFEGITEKTA
jgi:dihydroorotate dehydrogenase (fumarate)